MSKISRIFTKKISLKNTKMGDYHLVAEQVEHFGTFVLEAVVLDLQAFESIGYLWFHPQRLRGHPSTNNVLQLKFPKFNKDY